jgi:Ca-activated chloride channel family protein
MVVRHTFRSDEARPVEAVYACGLPRDAALRQFRIEGKDFNVTSDLRPVDEASKLYESGIQDGHLSALARQYGDGLVNLSIGNLQPGEEVSIFLEVLAGVDAGDDGYRFRFPFCLAPSYHRQARAAEAEPGVGEMELPEDRFGDLLLPRFRKSAEGLHRIGFEVTVHQPDRQGEVSSPSHTIRVRPEREGIKVSLAREKDLPNRDLVLDVKYPLRKPMVFTGLDAQGRGQLAALVPSASFGTPTQEPARVVVVLDRSGSMSGGPLQQAKKAVEACLAAFSPDDMFGIVVFDDQTAQFMPGLSPADREHRKLARDFLKRYQAGGGTELEAALRSAGSLFEGPGGDLLLVTDGQVFETETILKTARQMGQRVHVLGIGSASQDRFLFLLARETGGVCRFLTPRERVDLGALELFAAIGRPVAEEVTWHSTGAQTVHVAPEPPAAVFKGSPLILYGETSGPGIGQMELSWGGRQPGALVIDCTMPDTAEPLAATLRLLRGARLLTDLDSRYVPSSGATGRREARRIEKRIQKLSEEFQLASRRMALVAVVEREGDREGELPRTHVVPVGMPEDVAFESYFNVHGELAAEDVLGDFMSLARKGTVAAPADLRSPAARPMFLRLRSLLDSSPSILRRVAPEAPGEETDLLVELAALIEPDGGMPGDSMEERVQRSLLALLCFRSQENTRGVTFKKHMERLLKFIQGIDRGRLSETVCGYIDRSLELLESSDFGWKQWAEVAEKLTQEKALKQTELARLLTQIIHHRGTEDTDCS